MDLEAGVSDLEVAPVSVSGHPAACHCGSVASVERRHLCASKLTGQRQRATGRSALAAGQLVGV